MNTTDTLAKVYEQIDAANAADPATTEVDGEEKPAALVYGQRMTAMLEEFQPQAGEELKIAIRGQHIERFAIPRSEYPEGRAGYYRWRNAQKKQHAVRLGEIMGGLGYDDAQVERVGQIVRKERIKEDADAQTLEDVASLVFLKYELDGFLAKYDSYTPEKYADILAKTWKKMSPKAHEAALANNPPREVVDLLHQGLKALEE